MHKRLCFALALASSPLCAQEPVDNDTPVPDTAPASMTEEQKLNDCLLRSAQTANGKVTLQEMRGWCTNGEEQDKICLLYTSPSPRDKRQSRMPSSA